MNFHDFDIQIFLKYGFVGIGTLLMLLSYNLINTAIKSGNIDSGRLNLIRIFLSFTTLVIIASFSYHIFNSLKSPVTIAVDPTNPDVWNTPKDKEYWYNAPYALATEDFIDENTKELINGVKFEFLLFEGIDNADKEDFKIKFKRMRYLVTEMAKKVDLKGKLSVRILRHKRVPTISFFNPKKNNGKDAIVYYIESLIYENGRPQLAFQTDHETLVSYFKDRFAKEWTEAQEIDIDRLKDSSVQDSYFFTP